MCDISARAALRHGPGESGNVSGSMFSITPVSPFFTRALFLFFIFKAPSPSPSSLCLRVWCAGKQMARARMTTRQEEEEESAENGADRERMGQPHSESGRQQMRKTQNDLVEFFPHVLGGLRSNPPIAPPPSTSEERHPQRATRLGVV